MKNQSFKKTARTPLFYEVLTKTKLKVKFDFKYKSDHHYLMYQRSELFFTGHNSAKLFLQKWSKPNAKGTIVFTHGHGEHSDCYHRLITAFESSDWNFIGWDLRGHGRSAGSRGFAIDFSEYVADYHLFLVSEIFSIK